MIDAKLSTCRRFPIHAETSHLLKAANTYPLISSGFITYTTCPAEPNAAATRIRILHQLIIAMSGSFDVVLDDGSEKRRVHLNRSYNGLYVCPMIWRELDNFSSGSVCMVLASNKYDEADYYRDYGDFLSARRSG